MFDDKAGLRSFLGSIVFLRSSSILSLLLNVFKVRLVSMASDAQALIHAAVEVIVGTPDELEMAARRLRKLNSRVRDLLPIVATFCPFLAFPSYSFLFRSGK
jgi:hypothetical protein